MTTIVVHGIKCSVQYFNRNSVYPSRLVVINTAFDYLQHLYIPVTDILLYSSTVANTSIVVYSVHVIIL